MNITKLLITPRRPVLLDGVEVAAGQEAEVVGEDNIAAIGATPSPHKYVRVDVFQGKEVQHHISDSVEWRTNVAKAEADKAVKEFQEQLEAEAAAAAAAAKKKAK